jgi:hypothetical protein
MKGLSKILVPGQSALSPRGLLARAMVLIVIFLVCHWAGLRPCTSVLTGTFTSVAGSTQLGSLLGILYALVFLAFVLVVPILLIASGLLFLLHRFWKPLTPIESICETGEETRSSFGLTAS